MATMNQHRGIHLAWIVVHDLKKAIKFYTDVVGLKVSSLSEEHGWVELVGEDGALLGLAQKNDHMDVQPGRNAVVTLTVKDIASETKQFKNRGAKIVGELCEVPGHVKIQSVRDPDGNLFQLVQCLAAKQVEPQRR